MAWLWHGMSGMRRQELVTVAAWELGAQQTKWRHEFIAAVDGEPACSHEHQPCICAPASASASRRQPSSSTRRMRSTQSDARAGSLRLTRSTRSSMPRGAPHAMAGSEGCKASASIGAGCGHGRQWRGGMERRRRRQRRQG